MMQKTPKHLVACLLLLSLLPRLGLELWAHHWLHEPPAASANVADGGKVFIHNAYIHCTCLEDTFVPATATHYFEFRAPERPLLAVLNVSNTSVHSISRIFSSLRGPPQVALL
jgi:hypothetical protein